VRAPAFLRRLVDRIGTAIDPSENLLDDGLARGREAKGAWLTEDDVDRMIADEPSDARRFWLRDFTPRHPTQRCVCGRPAVRRVLIGWRGRRLSEVAPEALFAWVCEDPDSDGHAGVVPVTRFPRSGGPVDEL